MNRFIKDPIVNRMTVELIYLVLGRHLLTKIKIQTHRGDSDRH